ncbi:MAG: alanine--tRNA ligase [Hamadaea sp.]|uniref:alanine--tRNA ligase n=1 Tax=Hamadaea sp. TaxID=2024425 RepID=UPI0018323D5F|nr:alanine--tRNA ligase [Hamadaea sp.]NUT21478.1 alanine--tRNA ligase [Hamadaea sp.]
MLSTDIRRTFLDYFAQRDHPELPSASLIPEDSKLLLVNAGMVPFAPYFLGRRQPPHPRLMTLQKCVRTVDIENVGKTTRHATSFEMLGNFSFGDYFKDEVVPWAYELLTEGYGLDRERLWVTVLDGDDETVELWRRLGFPDERIQPLGVEDNYWSMGLPGPGGPSSEIFYDRGEQFGPGGGPAVNKERFLELWNLVFIHQLRGDSDTDIRGELPARNIDTGLGVDRLALVLQERAHICETDLLSPTLRRLQEITSEDYSIAPTRSQTSYRIVSDHLRAGAFLIADGVLPGNEGRGYVVRRLLRRVVRHGRLLGIDGPFLGDLVGTVLENLGGQWPELITRRPVIEQVVSREEEAFDRTVRQGSRLLDVAILSAKPGGVLPGSTAFELHDTYGFPVDLTAEIAEDAGLSLDRDEFGLLMQAQRRRAREAQASGSSGTEAYRELLGKIGPTEFFGYDRLSGEVRVVGLVGGDGTVATEGGRVEVILDRSPFYAEAGGQVGDSGVVRTRDGGVIRVDSTKSIGDGLYVHSGQVVSGVVSLDDEVFAEVDGVRRAATARAHSATHVLHATLREHLGEHAQQHGSLVEPGRLRFDFTHFDAVGADRLAEIEEQVNERLLSNPEVRVWHATRAEAERAGATALFGEKYGDTVRIVDIGDFSRELCGGTHVGYGSQAGPVRLLGEESVGAGLRRVSALVGMDALRHADRERRVLGEVTRLLGSPTDTVVQQLTVRLGALSDAEKRLSAYRRRELDLLGGELATWGEPCGLGRVVVRKVTGVTGDELRGLAADVLRRLPEPGVVVLGLSDGGRAQLVAAVSNGEAVDLLRDAGREVGGGAGGTGPVANAGGRRVEGLDRALELARTACHRVLGGN